MAGKYAIETVFSAIDAMTAPIKKMTRSVVGFGGVTKAVGAKINSDISKANEKLDSIGENIGGTFAKAAAAGVAAVSAGIVVATKQYVEFEASLRSAGAAFADLNEVQKAGGIEAYENSLKDLGAQVRLVAAATEFDAMQAGNAMATMARAGLSSEQAKSALLGVADAATAAGVSMDDAVGMVLGSVNSLGMASDVPEIMAANMTHLADVMAYTADSANMNMNDVSEAIKVAGNAFRDANNTGANNIDTLSAMTTALARVGFTGSEAGKAIQSMMQRLSAPAAAGAKALDRLGVSIVDDNNQLKDMSVIADEFNAAFSRLGITGVTKTDMLSDIFGKNYYAQAEAILAAGGDQLRQYEKSSLESAGAAAAKAGKIRASMQNQIAVLFSGLTEMGFQFVEGFQNPFVGAMKSVNNAISKMNTGDGADGLTQMQRIGKSFEPVVKALQDALIGLLNELPNIAKWVGNIVVLLVKAFSAVWNLRGVIMPFIVGIMAYKGIIMAIAVGIKVWNAAMAAGAIVTATMTAAKTAETGATVAATGAQWGFNAAMAANPVGLVIVAITALIAAIVLLVQHWDAVKNAVVGAWTAMNDFMNGGSLLADALSVVLWPLNMIRTAIAGIVETIRAFKNGGIIEGLRTLGASILKFVLSPIQSVLNLLSHIPVIGDKFKAMSNGISDFVANVQGGTATSAPNEAATVAPMTSAEKTSYLRSENVTENRLQIGVEKGATASWTGQPAPNVTLTRALSASW